MRGASLTTNAKASGRKLTLMVIKDLEKDREPWMADVVRKSELLSVNMTLSTRNGYHRIKTTKSRLLEWYQQNRSLTRVKGARPLTPALLEMSEWTAPPALLGVEK